MHAADNRDEQNTLFDRCMKMHHVEVEMRTEPTQAACLISRTGGVHDWSSLESARTAAAAVLWLLGGSGDPSRISFKATGRREAGPRPPPRTGIPPLSHLFLAFEATLGEKFYAPLQKEPRKNWHATLLLRPTLLVEGGS